MPEKAKHIANPLSAAPGFYIDNLFVMAGVPQIFQVMVQNIMPHLKKGTPFQSRNIRCPFTESIISASLADIQQQYPQTSIGSYPRFDAMAFPVEITVRSRDATVLQQATAAIENMIAMLSKQV